MISQHAFTFPFLLPRVLGLIRNWPLYLRNYLGRKRNPAVYEFRNGLKLEDPVGTLAGTIAVVFLREEYGDVRNLKTIIDIGANMGCFTTFAAMQSPNARVFSFEPEARNFETLRRNISQNNLGSRVNATRAAIAARDEVRSLSVSADSPMNSLVFDDIEAVGTQEVPCISIGRILAENKIDRIDFLKVNCEGAEYEIFETMAQEDLKRVDRIALEYHTIDDKEKNGPALRKLLEARGLKVDRYTKYKDSSGFIWCHW